GLRSFESTRTTAGPIANQLLHTAVTSQLGETWPRMIRGSIPRASATGTTSGTREAGTANSRGTNRACVGTVKPAPVAKRIWLATAIPTTYSAAVGRENLRSSPANTG